MTCANVLSFPVDASLGLYRSPPALIPRLGIHPPKDSGRPKRSQKRVVFADSKGLSLTSVCVFSKRDEKLITEPLTLPRLRKLSPAKKQAADLEEHQRPKFRLGFAMPCADFHAFRRHLQESAVLLESCYVTERALFGTVRVRNVSYEKSVQVRVTFDSWRTYRDVPCAFLRQLYGELDTDMFAFDILFPGNVDWRERVEFCVSYQPGGYSEAVWDNNYGQNYSIHVGD